MPSAWARRLAIPAAVLVLALAVTALFVQAADDAEQEQRRLHAARQADAAEADIAARMAAYEHVLRGAQAFHAASAPLSRHEWHTYVQRLGLEDSHPGIQGVGYIAKVAPLDVGRFEAAARGDGAPGFEVHPEPTGLQPLAPLLYVEPMGNASSLGFDLYSEPQRRLALDEAAATGNATLTAPLGLIGDPQGRPSFLMVMPVYRGGASEVPDWRNQTDGWLTVAFRADGVLGIPVDPSFAYEVRDASANGTVLHASDSLAGKSLAEDRTMRFGGRLWTLTVHTATGPRLGPVAGTILAAGLLSSLLLASITWSLASTRERAERRAADMTRDLYAKEARFRALAETASDAIVHADASGRVVYANPAVERVLGWRPEDLVGENIDVLMPHRLRAAHHAGFTRVVQGGPPKLLGRTTSLPALHRNGHEVPMELSLSSWTAPEGRYFSGILRDMTERQAHERALRDREARLTEAQAIAGLGSWETDLATGTSRWSDQLWRIHGLEPRAEISVGEASGLLHPDDLPAAEEATRAALARNTPFQYEIRFRRPDGSLRWLEVRGTPIFEGGRPVALRGTSQDITERKAAEEARRVAEERQLEIQRLEEANRFRAHFLNVSAHELATPLTPLRLQVQLLEMADQQRPVGDFRRNVAIVSRGVERLARLIRDILDSARIQAGRLGVHLAPLDLAALAREAIDAFADPARQASVRLELEAPRPVEVEGDATRLAQVLDNLLSNALKFTPEGGAIRVRVEGTPEEATVRVADTGIGLTAQQRDRLFQPFTQVHDPEQARERGTGLGLYISRGIVERHGGRLEVESEGPGKGTTFWFRMPRRQPPGAADAHNG